MPYLAFLLKILPLIQILVHIAEIYHPQPGSGAEKMKLVVSTVGKIAEKIPELANDVEKVKEAARPLIEDVVAVMNNVKATQEKLVGSGEPGQG